MNPRFAGVDGCRYGWVVAWYGKSGDLRLQMMKNLHGFVEGNADTFHYLVDIPIGLPDACNPVRTCDTLARKLLGGRLASRVFSPACREALVVADYRTACEVSRSVIGRAISIQSWNLRHKIIEIDELVQSSRGCDLKLSESHPELAFAYLNNGYTIEPPKATEEGLKLRLEVLKSYFPDFDLACSVDCFLTQHRRSEVKKDDVLDAIALLVMAYSKGRFHYLPEQKELDARGVRKVILTKRFAGV